MKTLHSLFLVSLFLFVTASPAPAAEAKKDLAEIARGSWPFANSNPEGLRAARGWVIRSEDEFVTVAGLLGSSTGKKTMTADLAKQLKIEAIDFSKHSLIVVSGGVKNTGGHRVEISRVAKDDKGVVAHWLAVGPEPGGFVTQAFTHPTAVLLIPKLAGDVRFEPAFGPGKNPPAKGNLRPVPLPRIKLD